MANNETNIGDYQIIAKRLPLDSTVGIAGHLYLQIVDPNGKLLFQFDGLAINDKNDVPLIGTPLDNIKVYTSKIPIWGKDSDKHESSVVYSTNSKEEIYAAINSMLTKSTEINAKNANYGLLTSNSNAVFSELIKSANSVVAIDPKNIEKAKNLGIINPGVDTEIVSSEQSPWWAKTVKAVAKTGTFLLEGVTGAFNSVVAWAGNIFSPKPNDTNVAENNQTPETQNNFQPVSNSSTQAYKAEQQPYGYFPQETPLVSQEQKNRLSIN